MDTINGVVREWGDRCSVPTPVNDRIVQVIKQIQNGTLTATEENLKLFTGLL